MIEKSIPFKPEMVRAILAGNKTMTRRVLKHQPVERGNDDLAIRYDLGNHSFNGPSKHMLKVMAEFGCKYRVGDLLWVREAHALVGSVDPPWVLYRASGYEAECERHGFDKPFPPESSVKWRPSIHMFRRDSRITLRVTDVKVERLQDISEVDARGEGLFSWPYIDVDGDPRIDGKAYQCTGWHWEQQKSPYDGLSTARDAFEGLWTSINGPASWDENPWCAAYTFERTAP